MVKKAQKKTAPDQPAADPNPVATAVKEIKVELNRQEEERRTARLVLVLRTIAPDGLSHGGFGHPLEVGGVVEAPDWHPRPECGGGIHGALFGEGDGSLFRWEELWMVYQVDPAEGLVEIDRAKCKFRRGTLVYIGDQPGATSYVANNGGAGRRIIGGTATAGDRGTATAGDRGTIVFKIWDSAAQRWRFTILYTGENGIEAKVPYRYIDGQIVKLES